MSEIKTQDRISDLFNSISSRYDRLNRILSGGLDLVWRRKLVEALPSAPHFDFLDIATGTADVLLTVLKTGRIGHAEGIDIADQMIAIGREKLKRAGYAQVAKLQVASALALPYETNSFSCAAISFGIRNVENVELALSEMFRVLKPGGRALILEFSRPQNRLFTPLYLFYLRHILPPIGGALTGNREAYSYLSRTIESFPSGQGFLNLMKLAGFSSLALQPLSLGIVTLYIGEKR